MPLMVSPAPAVEVVALLSSATSRCEIRKRQSDDEAGDPVEVKCGAITRRIGQTQKGVTVDRIDACWVTLTTNAVRAPRLLSLSNCRGPLVVTDVGGVWVKQLQKLAGIKPERVEFVSYEKLPKRVGCYNVTVTYDAIAGAQNTSFKEKSGNFCVKKQ